MIVIALPAGAVVPLAIVKSIPSGVEATFSISSRLGGLTLTVPPSEGRGVTTSTCAPLSAASTAITALHVVALSGMHLTRNAALPAAAGTSASPSAAASKRQAAAPDKLRRQPGAAANGPPTLTSRRLLGGGGLVAGNAARATRRGEPQGRHRRAGAAV